MILPMPLLQVKVIGYSSTQQENIYNNSEFLQRVFSKKPQTRCPLFC